MGAAFLLATAVVHPAFADDGRRTRRGAGERRGRAGRRRRRRQRRDDGAPAKRDAQARGKSRRGHGAKFAGPRGPREPAAHEPLPRPSGNLEIVSLANPNDRAKVNIYNADGSYNLDAVEELNFVLRCRRTDAEKPIDIQLLTWLSPIYDHFGGKPLQIVSGYRNQRKQTSNHFKGRATDIRIEGVSPKQVRAFAETLDRGGMGIGLYPRSSSSTSTFARRPATAGSTTRRRIRTRPRSARPAAGSARSSSASRARGRPRRCRCLERAIG